MLRSSLHRPLYSVRVSAAFAVVSLIATAGESTAIPQTSSSAPAAEALPKSLEQLLSAWHRSSSTIERLEGEHLTHTYDSAFEVEKMSQGHFYYIAPDKGRIDMEPVRVTRTMEKQRASGEIPARRKANGEPYTLQEPPPERWICDGLRVYEIKDDLRQATVAQLPPQMQGTNIMNSPLPFLFGLPPEEMKERFRLSWLKEYKRGDRTASVHAIPRLPRDAANWSEADVILDVTTFLPIAVQIKKSGGEEIVVHSFKNVHKNKNDGLIARMFGRDPFSPDLKGYEVNVQRGDGAASNSLAARDPDVASDVRRPILPAVVPNLKGMYFKDAQAQLEKLGLTEKGQVQMHQGPPAPSEDLVFTVIQQAPKAGTPLNGVKKVDLQLYKKP